MNRKRNNWKSWWFRISCPPITPCTWTWLRKSQINLKNLVMSIFY